MNGFNLQIQNLKNALSSGTINRSNHWKEFRLAVKNARKNQVSAQEKLILGQIDTQFFNNWTVPKLPVTAGTIALLAGTLILEVLYYFLLPFITNFWINVILYFVISVGSFTLSHTVFHWLFGRLVGIRFQSYFLFKSTFRKSRYFAWSPVAKIPIFGIKYDLDSFLDASKWRRTIMFVSAPIFSWLWFLLNYYYLSIISNTQRINLLGLGVLILIIFVISQLSGYYFYGDYWKARQDY